MKYPAVRKVGSKSIDKRPKAGIATANLNIHSPIGLVLKNLEISERSCANSFSIEPQAQKQNQIRKTPISKRMRAINHSSGVAGIHESYALFFIEPD